MKTSDDRLRNLILRYSGAGENLPWAFPDLSDWSFSSLEEGLTTVATLGASNERFYWWLTADICAAILERFGKHGRKERIKSLLAHALGCSTRTVEIRVRAARTFPPESRKPDVPVELYKASLEWEEPRKTLEFALQEGLNSADLERRRLSGSGKLGPVLFRRQVATLFISRDGDETIYDLRWTERMPPRFARSELRVVATVRELLATEQE